MIIQPVRNCLVYLHTNDLFVGSYTYTFRVRLFWVSSSFVNVCDIEHYTTKTTNGITINIFHHYTNYTEQTQVFHECLSRTVMESLACVSNLWASQSRRWQEESICHNTRAFVADAFALQVSA